MATVCFDFELFRGRTEKELATSRHTSITCLLIRLKDKDRKLDENKLTSYLLIVEFLSYT